MHTPRQAASAGDSNSSRRSGGSAQKTPLSISNKRETFSKGSASCTAACRPKRQDVDNQVALKAVSIVGDGGRERANGLSRAPVR